jgi:hypothetical protein
VNNTHSFRTLCGTLHSDCLLLNILVYNVSCLLHHKCECSVTNTAHTADTAVLQQSSLADAALSGHNALLNEQRAILQNVALCSKR